MSRFVEFTSIHTYGLLVNVDAILAARLTRYDDGHSLRSLMALEYIGGKNDQIQREFVLETYEEVKRKLVESD